jgi:GT2 family glycosyltransferase
MDAPAVPGNGEGGNGERSQRIQEGDMLPTVSVVVIDYKIDITPCLNSLREQTFKDFEIIVVDNNVINRGFAGGCNKGIREARGEYIALLNNDARADKDWLKEIVAFAEARPDVGVFASKILRSDGKIDSAGGEVYPDGNGMCRGRGETAEQYNDPNYVDFPSGCAALYRRSMLDEIGLFDERFFMYNEDTDLGIRAQKAGWKCIYVPTAIVTHLYSQSSSAYSLKKLFRVERNRILLMLKNFTFRQILASVPWTFIRYFKLVRGAA